MTELQFDFDKPTLQQQFNAWKETPGGKHVLNHAYRLAAGYAARWQKRKQRVAVALIWELLRYRVAWIRAGLTRRGLDLAKWDGFTFNNNFRAYVARHMMEHRPEWKGMFELREVGKVRKKERTIIIKEKVA